MSNPLNDENTALEYLEEMRAFAGIIQAMNDWWDNVEPLTQAELIADGLVYELVAKWGTLEGHTKEETVSYLKEQYNPDEAFRLAFMPFMKSRLLYIEKEFVERRYKLPKWDRPGWLTHVDTSDIKSISIVDKDI